jgi:hypothetical protein
MQTERGIILGKSGMTSAAYQARQMRLCRSHARDAAQAERDGCTGSLCQYAREWHVARAGGGRAAGIQTIGKGINLGHRRFVRCNVLRASVRLQIGGNFGAEQEQRRFPL